MNNKKRVAIAMSGGVDSSAAALLLKKQGWDVIGLSMKLWDAGQGGAKKKCCSIEDFRDARRVADALGTPYFVLNMKEEFKKRVIDNFISNYLAGRTPNPCALCNSEMKFDLLLKKARSLGAGYLATGHYARIEFDKTKKRFILRKGVDKGKDQSYFLFGMTQQQLAATLFPLGGMRKEEVRKMLRDEGIQIAGKHESQDICFVDTGRYPSFVEKTANEQGLKKGWIIDEKGEPLGRHNGLHNFTIGQRRGLGVSLGRRIYVSGFDAEKGDVFVGDEKCLSASGLIAEKINWIACERLSGSLDAKTRTRYGSVERNSTISPFNGGKVKVEFDRPERAVTPGQAVVFYHDDTVIGGGWIERALK